MSANRGTVTEDDIAKVEGGWTGIPVARLAGISSMSENSWWLTGKVRSWKSYNLSLAGSGGGSGRIVVTCSIITVAYQVVGDIGDTVCGWKMAKTAGSTGPKRNS